MPPISAVFAGKLKKGDSGPNVVRLQTLLATDASVYPEGITTGYFGDKTVAAVVRFQIKYGIIQSAMEEGAGMLGPKTRAKIAEIFSPAHIELFVTPKPSKWFAPIRVDKFVVTQVFLAPDAATYPITGHHPGVDYGTQGTTDVPLYYCADGEVIESGLHASFGNYFFYFVPSVDRTFVYFHLQDIAPSKGVYNGGAQCGFAGKSGKAFGIHLHLECLKGKKTSADRAKLFTSFASLQNAAEDADAFIRGRIQL